MATDNINIEGIVTIDLYGPDRVLKHSETVHNLVTTAGKNFIVRKINNDAEELGFIALGSGDTPATVNDTGMDEMLAEEIIRFSLIDSINTNVLINTTYFIEGVGTGTVREIGLFSNSDPKKLICRTVVTTPFSKSFTDYLNVSWKIKIG